QFNGRPAFFPSDRGAAPLPDTVHELLHNSDVGLQSDWRFRLFEVVKTLRREDTLPVLPLAEIEVLEIFKVEQPLAPNHLKADFTAWKTRRGEFGGNPHLAHDPPRKADLRHDTLCGRREVTECINLGKDPAGGAARQPEEEVGVVRGNVHEHPA